MPGVALLAIMGQVGFVKASLAGLSSYQSSPYTGGALFTARKPGLLQR
jgi:hypothetical protein